MKLIVRRLGLCDYLPIWQAMVNFTKNRHAGQSDEIWLLQHTPVYTNGCNGRRQHIHYTGDIPVVQTDRGGQVTYHGPGQLICYTLMDIQRLGFGVSDFVAALEQILIDWLGRQGIESHRRSGAPGVYINDAKLASVGLRVKRQGSYHGISLNVNMDLAPFSQIDPCGYSGLSMTQLIDHRKDADISLVMEQIGEAIAQRFNYQEFVYSDLPIEQPSVA